MAESTREQSATYGYGAGIRGTWSVYGSTYADSNARIEQIVSPIEYLDQKFDGEYWKWLSYRTARLLAKREQLGDRADECAGEYWRLVHMHSAIKNERPTSSEDIERKQIMSNGTYNRYQTMAKLERECREEIDAIDLELYRLIAPDPARLYRQLESCGVLAIQNSDRDSVSDSDSDSVSTRKEGN